MKKIFIATSRDIGKKCLLWASENLIDGFCLTDSIEKADIVISVLYNKLFKDGILDKQCYNFHPGVLPSYRGSGICSWVIINEEKFHGATLHIIDGGIDTGPIIEVKKFSITDDDTACSLFKKTENVIYEMFKHWFHKLLRLDFTAIPQNITERSAVYLRKDLKDVMNLTKFIKAFYFPNKEASFYYNKSRQKVYISYDLEEEDRKHEKY